MPTSWNCTLVVVRGKEEEKKKKEKEKKKRKKKRSVSIYIRSSLFQRADRNGRNENEFGALYESATLGVS